MAFNIRDYGAVGDGVALDQQALQTAIDACAATGGGTVIVPSGNYLTGTVQVKSGVNLHLEAGARIVAADDAALYPVICPTPFGNLPGQIQAVIWIEKASGVRVTGPGVIDGGGAIAPSYNDACEMFFRPALVFCRDCHDLQFLEVTLLNTRFWTLHLMRCDDVAIRGINIWNNQDMPNSDGIDPDGCRNMIISDCNIRTGDDAIVIKSTEGDPCENIVISNCIVSSRCAALKLGTEVMGDMRDIIFANCIVQQANVVIALYMKDGTTFENIRFSNINMTVDNPFPVVVDITPRYYKEPRKGFINNVVLDGIAITGQGRCYIEGLPEQPIAGLTLRDITWNITGPCEVEKYEKPIGARRVESDPERQKLTVFPYHFLIFHVDGLDMTGIKLYDRQETPDHGIAYIRNVHNGLVEIRRPITPPAGVTQVDIDECTAVAVRV